MENIIYKSVIKLPKTNYHIILPMGVVLTDTIKTLVDDVPCNKVIVKFKGTEAEVFINPSNIMDIANNLWKKILLNPSWCNDINKQAIRYATDFLDLNKSLTKEKIKTLKNSELWELWEKGYEYTIKKQTFGFISSILDYFSNKMTNELMLVLNKYDDKNTGKYYSLLTQTIEGGLTREERIDFLNMACDISRNPDEKTFIINSDYDNLPVRLKDKLKEHANKYGRLWYFYDGPSYKEADFLNLLKEELQNKDICEKLQLAKVMESKVRNQKQDIYNKFPFTDKEKQLFDIATSFITTKNIEKELDSLGWSHRELLFDEIGKRLNISIDLVKKLLPTELKESLQTNHINKDLLELRFENSILEINRGIIKVYQGSEVNVFWKNFEKYLEKIEDSSNVIEISGQSAFPGKVDGIVRIVSNAEEANAINEGDIIVAALTNQDMIIGIKRAAAIVTDTGGITSHAAITAREFEIPCVVGTEIATKVLKNNEKIEVDADNGIVKIIKKKACSIK